MSVGMTTAQRRALNGVIGYFAVHGRAPSLRLLANQLGCATSNARRLVDGLVERGHLLKVARGGISLPAHLDGDLAKRLCNFCCERGEDVGAVIHDAIMLHLDQIEGARP